MIPWIALESEEQLSQLHQDSFIRPQLVFKHSTRCSISHMAKSRLENAAPPPGIDFFYLDLLSYRHISGKLADVYKVHHESPQVLLIKNGECVYDESHTGISMQEVQEMSITA